MLDDNNGVAVVKKNKTLVLMMMTMMTMMMTMMLYSFDARLQMPEDDKVRVVYGTMQPL